MNINKKKTRRPTYHKQKLTDAEEGAKLRDELTTQIKHIRVCTLTLEELCSEVIPSRILTDEEVRLVCMSHGTKEKQSELTEICNEIEPRSRAFIISKLLHADIMSCGVYIGRHAITSLEFFITTNKNNLELTSLLLTLPTQFNFSLNGTVYIRGPLLIEDDSSTSIATDFSVEFNYSLRKVPLSTNDKTIELLSASRYTIQVTFTSSVSMYYLREQTYSFNDFTIDLGDQNGYFYYCIEIISYKTKT